MDVLLEDDDDWELLLLLPLELLLLIAPITIIIARIIHPIGNHAIKARRYMIPSQPEHPELLLLLLIIIPS
jgi:hypothetical protein